MSIIVLAAALVLFVVLRVIAAPEDAAPTTDGDYAEYENAVVTNVLSDTTFADPTADNALRGEQLLLAEVKTGRRDASYLHLLRRQPHGNGVRV